jgi:hypothetical protein
MKKRMLGLIIGFLMMSGSMLAQTYNSPGYYGPGLHFDGLGNHQVADVDVDYRIRALHTGVVQNLIWYDIHKIVNCPPISGATYGCGTGGTMHICIQTDDGTSNHLATGINVGSCMDVSGFNMSTNGGLRTDNFSGTLPNLTAGMLYHIHWHNIDPNLTSNFVSVDANEFNNGVVASVIPRQPTISDLDEAVFRGTTLYPIDTPIYQLAYTDGYTQGMGYMEDWIGTPKNISGTANKVREQFTVSGADRTVSSVAVRLNRVSGASPLTVTLETGSGSVIEQGTISAASFPLTSTVTLADFATYTFATPRTLTSGQSYHLVFSSPSDTVYQAFGIRRGPSYGFTTATFFGDGYGQWTTDGGSTWTGFQQSSGGPGTTIADVQFYFTVGSPVTPPNPPSGLTATVQ